MACTCTNQTTTTAAALAPAPCDAGAERPGLERTRFFPRQLVTPDDLTQDQIYFREKHRRHNRMLHGWGVVCGACVRRGKNPCEVVVDAGYLLGPYGDEIVIPEPVTLDLCKMGVQEQAGCCGAEADPWCSDVRQRCPEGVVYLAVRYAECETRPVRTAGACGCGCDSDPCEYSRIRDSYTFKLLTELPATYPSPFRAPPITVLSPCLRDRTARSCPPCPSEPWVILADIAIGADCRIGTVDCFAHRRYVVTFADFFLTCAGARQTPGVATVAPSLFENTVTRARMMASVTGASDLVDVDAAGFDATPQATVTMRRADGSAVAVPAFFSIEPGDTLADLLEREGDRQFYDPATDDSYTLRELYAAAGAPLDTPLRGAASALAPLEGLTLDVGALRAERTELTSVLDREGLTRLERDLGGATGRVGELPAATLVGVAPDSAAGRRVADLTIGDVAGMEREAFVARLLKSVPQRQRGAVERQAGEIWDAARRATGTPNHI